MKIVQVQTQAEAAGAQRISDMVGDGLRARGHQVRTFFIYRKTDAYDHDTYADFGLDRRPSGPLDQMRAVLSLFAYLVRERPEAVISYQHYGNLLGTLGALLSGARLRLANQSGAPQRGGLRGIATALDKLFGWMGLYHFNIVNSAWTEAQFSTYPRGYRSHLRRIDHGVATPPVHQDRVAARRTFNLPLHAPLIVSTGRLNAQKNHALLVRALTYLPDAHLAIAGIGPERTPLLALGQQLGLATRLHLVGELSSAGIFKFLASGDLFAFPSQLETFGLSAVEAAIAGLPLVVSDLPVLREVLSGDDGDAAALFVMADDVAGFAAAITRILEHPALATRLSTAGRGLGSRYAADTMCAAYAALLK